MKSLTAAATAVLLTGCTMTSPVLAPNAHLQEVGEAQAQRDIWRCKALADLRVRPAPREDLERFEATGGATGEPVGHIRGVITGHPPRAAALIPTSITSAWKDTVSRCLKERGYEVLGWTVQAGRDAPATPRVALAAIRPH